MFGEHLLRERPTAYVGIVESEKTALIMTHFIPDFIWLATGGMDGCFSANTMQVLRGRTIVLFPDLGGMGKWQKKAHLLEGICKRITISNVIENIATNEQREKGLDIADFFLTQPTCHEILTDMIRKNPAIQQLIDSLDLVLSEEDENMNPP